MSRAPLATSHSALAARQCRRLPWYEGPGDEVLARGEALLEGLAAGGGPAMRWYVTSPPALYLGAGEGLAAVDAAACRAEGIAVYKRAAGGAAVLSDEDTLNLDVALPPGHPLWQSDLTQSYRWLGEVWSAALRRLGQPAVLLGVPEARAAARDASEEARLARAACYGALSPFEVTLDGRKVVGLAQVRRRAGALLQVGVLLRWRPERLSSLLAAPPQGRAALTAALAARAVGLDDYAGQRVCREQIMAAVEEGLAAAGLEPVDSAWTPAERALTARLRAERYRPLSGDLAPAAQPAAHNGENRDEHQGV